MIDRNAVEIAKYTSFEQCQWIDGEPTLDDDCKCLKQVEYKDNHDGRPYCAEHLPLVKSKGARNDAKQSTK